MRIVIALGGNALLERGQPPEAEVQRRNTRRASQAVAKVAQEHDVVLTHGNGPQVGLLALQSAAYREVSPYPLDMLGAESEGMIGYLIEQELSNFLPERNIATLLTQTVVQQDDPAFENPTKFVGPVYSEEEARRLSRELGWAVAQDGRHFRRVVASPRPVRIVELPTIRLLVQHGVLVVCTGGGGIPVAVDESGAIQGVEAVVDKDRASALLAEGLAADWLLMLTDVPAVYDQWGTDRQRAIRRASPSLLEDMDFAEGSMGPKVEAACRFVASDGRKAGIGALDDAFAILRGEAGTVIEAGVEGIVWGD